MAKTLLVGAMGSVAATSGCANSWCPVTRHVVELNSIFDKVSFSGCLNLCLLRDGETCQGFTWESADSKAGECTHYKFDEQGVPLDVFSYFPIVDLAKVLPETAYTYKQVSAPTTVTGLDQCRDELRASSDHAVFATFGNQACGKEPTHTASIVDGEYVATEVILNFIYNPTAVGLGVAKGRYLTLTDSGFALKSTRETGSDWTWSHGGVEQISNNNPVCLSAQDDLKPIYDLSSEHSQCAMGQRGGSPDKASMYGWVMQNSTAGNYKCMGEVTRKGNYDLIAIEDPVNGICNTNWQVQARNIVGDSHSALTSRQCETGALDGAWVDGQLYPTGDFSAQWFDKLTIVSGDKQLLAHTRQGDSNVPFGISVDGCSITVYLHEGCDECIATGTLSEGGNTINWDTGFNDGDYWIRKNHGCCTLFNATLKTPSSLVPRTTVSKSSPKDAACAQQFSEGRWVDRSKGDFAFSWVPYMELSADPLEDDANGRMTAPVVQGSWVLPVNFFEDGGMCKLKLCLEKPCAGEGYSIGTLEAGEIHWDDRLNDGKWHRLQPSDACNQADSKYSCCDANGKVGCAFAPNKAVCDELKGQFCCDPEDPYKQCGFEPAVTPTLV